MIGIAYVLIATSGLLMLLGSVPDPNEIGTQINAVGAGISAIFFLLAGRDG